MLFVVVIAVAMTAPMVAWMRFRGHTWRSCNEMGAAMLLPAVPFIVLYWLGVIAAPFCSLYCAASFAAMIALMVYRAASTGGGPDRARVRVSSPRRQSCRFLRI